MMSHRSSIGRLFPLALGAGLLAAFSLLFLRYFPNSHGAVGNDYSLGFSQLLDGVYWVQNNGLSAIEWFSPSWCGGAPSFPEPVNGFFSLPQWLMFVMNPLAAVWLTIFLFALAGLTGMYGLLRYVFRTSQAAAWLASAVFLFNGFYLSRMWVGHLGFHSFMLVPLSAALLLVPAGAGANFIRRHCYAVLAGLIFAYMLMSAMTSEILPVGLALCMIASLYSLVRKDPSPFLPRAVGAVLIGVGIGAAKLAAAAAFLAQFPRDKYPLGGADSVLHSASLALQAIFFLPPEELLHRVWLHPVFDLERHELEYGVTVIPPILLAAAAVLYFRRTPLRGIRMGWRRALILAALVCLCALPVLLNFYSPGWNQFLKHVPLFSSFSSNVRFYSSYIPLAALAAALSLDAISPRVVVRNSLAALGIALVLLWNFSLDRSFYDNQQYDPRPIMAAYAQAVDHGPVPIQFVGAFVDARGAPALALNRNDLIVVGGSQLVCYYPEFGYRLEYFPRKSLHGGSIFEEHDGVLNLKNPACYVYPQENGCAPGDHFRLDQREAAERFAHREPFAFAISARQKAADVLSVATILGVVAWLLLAVVPPMCRRRGRWLLHPQK